MWVPVVDLFKGSPPLFLRELGFVTGSPGTLLAWSLGLIFAIIYAAFAVRNIPLVREHWRAVSLFKLLGVLVAISAAIVEEAFFRGFLMDALMRIGWPAVVQVLASGIIFGLAHGIWGIMTGRVFVGVATVIATGIFGFALGLLYLIGDRSLAPVIVAHFIVTATIQPGITFAAFSGQMHKAAGPNSD